MRYTQQHESDELFCRRWRKHKKWRRWAPFFTAQELLLDADNRGFTHGYATGRLISSLISSMLEITTGVRVDWLSLPAAADRIQ